MPVIELQQLTKHFGDLTAVNALDLDIHAGEILGILGPNGAGKTTTIRMICGLIQPSAGKVIFNLKDESNPKQARTRLGVCPQENIFWPKLTCLEQLQFNGRIYGLSRRSAYERSLKLLADLGLAEKENVLATKLSGGMKRRLSIALALVHDPEILILDEPEAGLDPQSRILVREFIRSLAEKRTVILTTHNMDEADRMAQRVVIIDRGVLQLVDTPTNLKRTLGEGDTLEIHFEGSIEDGLTEMIESLLPEKGKVQLGDQVILVRALGIVDILERVNATLRKAGVRIHRMTLRENTLEDVFIHLTGRQLRQ